jgi:hypothetical protein
MNLNRRWQMSNNLKKIQIIKMLALKQKVKCHFMKQGDNISEGSKQQSDYLFLFSISKFQLFLFPKWVLKKILWRYYKNSLKKSCWSWKRNKKDWNNNKNLQTFFLCNLGLQNKVCLFLLQFIRLLFRNPLWYPSLKELLKQLGKTRKIVRKH